MFSKAFVFLSLLFLPVCAYTQVQPELVASIALRDARLFTTDETGNIYVITGNNELLRFNENGDSTGYFRSVLNGEVSHIDASNPLRVLLYFGAFSKIVLLDRMLSPKNELDLKKLNIFNPPAVAVSADGKIWIYDFVNARLLKIDDNLNVVLSSNDMRMEIREVPSPVLLVEKDYKVYACDSVNGIFTFDRFGTYINTLEMPGIAHLQVVGSQLIYPKADTLYAYDQQRFLTKTIALNAATPEILNARVERSRLYILYKNRLDIFIRPE